MIRRGVLCGLLACLVLATAVAEDRKGPLEGKWKFVNVETNDKDTMIEQGFVLTFDKDKAWLEEQKERFAYTIDTKSNPALLDVTTPDKKRIEGIWDIKGDVLRICIFPPDNPQGRPTEFHGRDGQILLTLKRVE